LEKEEEIEQKKMNIRLDTNENHTFEKKGGKV